VIVCALMVVVVGHALLANGQVRMASIQKQLVAEQANDRQIELSVQTLEMPSRIVSAALAQHMVHPTQVVELPFVALTTPLPTPKVTPAPVVATTSTTTPST
jgi:hypothetical protein